MQKTSAAIEHVELTYQNSVVKVVLTRPLPEITYGDMKIGPLNEGQEIELPLWLSDELIKAGAAKLRQEEPMTLNDLSKIHWRETIPASRQLPQLDPNFYAILRRFIRKLEQESMTNRMRIKDYDKALSLARDVMNCRVRKLVSLAGAPALASEVTQHMALEERALYEQLRAIIAEWKDSVLKLDTLD